MPLYHILLLAVIQGLTEFLPVSSSGHLVVAHRILEGSAANLCWEENRLMDVAVHVGTLLSVLVYFRHDLLAMVKNTYAPGGGWKQGLLAKVILASLPVIVAGLLLQITQPSFLCLVEIMAWMTLVFGILLWFADRFETVRTVESMRMSSAFIIGLSQALALIPGVSRSGITMTTARFFGLTRVDAAKFSLLLSIVAISGAGFLGGIDLWQDGDMRFGIDIIFGIVLSFFSGWIAIALMMKWLSRSTFTPFVIYRILLGTLLLALIYSGIL
jgi:undecaprenyl-diphosphatase